MKEIFSTVYLLFLLLVSPSTKTSSHFSHAFIVREVAPRTAATAAFSLSSSKKKNLAPPLFMQQPVGFVRDDSPSDVVMQRDVSLSAMDPNTGDVAEYGDVIMTDTASTPAAPAEMDFNLGLIQQRKWHFEALLPIFSSAFLITGNTFCSGCLVLPELVQGPGVAASSAVFGAAYVFNLISGLVLAEVAINAKEASGGDVPCSFKEFVEVNFRSSTLANVIAGMSFAINALVFTFDLSRVGALGTDLSGGWLNPAVSQVAWAAVVFSVLSSQTQDRLSQLASVAVAGLLFSLGSILMPSLAANADPMAFFNMPGADVAGAGSGVGALASVVVMSLVFQNIVPTIVKLQNYDRTKTMASILLGSIMPLLMYMAYCYSSLVGGGEGGMAMSGPLLTIFTFATLSGSAIGCGMSCASEMDNFFQAKTEPMPVKPLELEKQDEEDDDEDFVPAAGSDRFQLPSVLATVSLPLTLALCSQGGDLTDALSAAGGVGAPLLYGLMPAVMAWNLPLRRQFQVPSTALLGLIGVSSTSLFASQLYEQVGQWIAI